MLFFFFFQAEDGIRDGHVTGVQTCALPISQRCEVSGARPEQDDSETVRREYADEIGLSARIALWARRPGPQPQDVAFDEVIAAEPRRVLEVGCGRGEFAERLLEVGIEVVAVDQSPRMVY